MAEVTEKTSTDEPILPWKVWVGVGVLLALVGGIAFYLMSKDINDLEGPLGSFLPRVMAVAGVLLGAGFGLILGDFRTSKTTEKTTKEPAAEGVVPGEKVIEESFKVIKDLTPGKTLIVLGVALVGLSLWAITPAKPDTEVNVPAATP